MGWNYKASLERVQKYLNDLGPITLEKLVRDADLYTLLSETNCRTIFGSHAYVDVTNFSRIVSGVDGENYRRVIQAIHLYQREVTRIVENAEILGGVRIHFQGPRLHALFFRPIDSVEDLAVRAVLLQVILREFVGTVFNPAFPKVADFVISGGVDLGLAIGTKNGTKGDRELLFLGAPANHAAKILGQAGDMNLTPKVYKALPDKVRKLYSKIDEEKYRLGAADTARDLAKAFGISWDLEASAARIEEDKRLFPLKDIEYSDAETLIDLDSLGITNNKRVLAASIFADVSGFTAFIDGATSTEDKKRAIRLFHAIRKEMATVIKRDFGALRIQYQGDRVQGLVHLPKDDASALVQKAVEIAAGLQSSMDYVIHAVLPESMILGLAVGIDLDTTLVSKTGTRGQRDRICLGLGVENATRIQERSNAAETSITPRCHVLLKSDVQKQFALDESRKFYVAKNLYTDVFEQLARAATYSTGAAVTVRSSTTGVTVGHREDSGGTKVFPAKSYRE